MSAVEPKEMLGRALSRNLNEVVLAIMERRVRIGIRAVVMEFEPGDIFHICDCALHNDAVAHLAKVLESNRQIDTFWRIYALRKDLIDHQTLGWEYGINEIRVLARKIKKIRDKTHFHISREYLNDPDRAWAEAGITGDEFDGNLKTIFDILNNLHILETGAGFIVPPSSTGDFSRQVSQWTAARSP